MTIEARECPKNREDWRKTFSIYPVGLTEQLMINLEYLCECDCEQPGVGVSLYLVMQIPGPKEFLKRPQIMDIIFLLFGSMSKIFDCQYDSGAQG